MILRKYFFYFTYMQIYVLVYVGMDSWEEISFHSHERVGTPLLCGSWFVTITLWLVYIERFAAEEIPEGLQWDALLSSNGTGVRTDMQAIWSARLAGNKRYWFEEMLEGVTLAIQWHIFNKKAYDLPIKSLTISLCYLGIIVQNKGFSD